jgi:NADH-quinone oxidoreductase subunit C
MTENLADLLSLIETKLESEVVNSQIANNELSIVINPHSILKCVEFLAVDNDCQFSTLIDITAVDYPEKNERFVVVYHFLSMAQNQRIRVNMEISEGQFVPSIVTLHPSANWFEREVFDMYGILFSGHPDLRRLLTDYGFTGHPLRKDFPTSGYLEVRYDEVKKQVVYEPAKLTQEYRQFDFLSPWEGAQNIKEETMSEPDGGDRTHEE